VAKGGQDGRPAAKTTTGPKVTAKAGVNAGATAPREGTKLPAFSLADHTGATVNRESLLGEPLVLYFYPKDDTPGCTKEACDFNAELKQFEGLGVRVVGVSPDSAARHVNFRNKYGLGFTLLSDPDAVLARALDVYQLKKNYGREYMGIVRSTFLIDRAGVIRKAWRAVRVAGHVPDVIDAAKSL
jgi:peroxiredoxin Q/BCP